LPIQELHFYETKLEGKHVVQMLKSWRDKLTILRFDQCTNLTSDILAQIADLPNLQSLYLTWDETSVSVLETLAAQERKDKLGEIILGIKQDEEVDEENHPFCIMGTELLRRLERTVCKNVCVH
jgi:hypothetical protein